MKITPLVAKMKMKNGVGLGVVFLHWGRRGSEPAVRRDRRGKRFGRYRPSRVTRIMQSSSRKAQRTIFEIHHWYICRVRQSGVINRALPFPPDSKPRARAVGIQRLTMGPIRNQHTRNCGVGWYPEWRVIFTWLGGTCRAEICSLWVIEHCEDFFTCEPP